MSKLQDIGNWAYGENKCLVQQEFFQKVQKLLHVESWNRVLTVPSARADDLIPEESDVVLLALKRLPPKEAYDRVFRLRRAFQVRNLSLTLFLTNMIR